MFLKRKIFKNAPIPNKKKILKIIKYYYLPLLAYVNLKEINSITRKND
jgi:hypothetical protein